MLSVSQKKRLKKISKIFKLSVEVMNKFIYWAEKLIFDCTYRWLKITGEH